MDAIVVGIDVSKGRLDMAVRPTQERFAVERDAEGLTRLIARLAPLEPQAIAIEASWSIPRRGAPSPRRSENGPRPTRSTRR